MSSQSEYILAGLERQHLAGEDTVGAFFLFENKAQVLHAHGYTSISAMTLYMLEGEMTALIAGEEHPVKIGYRLFTGHTRRTI